MRSALLLVLALVLAGCATPFAGTHTPAGPTTWTGFFDRGMGLAPAAEENESVVRTGGFYESWAAGLDYPTWFAEAPSGDALVTGLNVTLFVRATGPVVESARFPDIMVYAGAGDAWIGYGDRRDLNAFVPGRVYELDVEIGLPEGGLWISPSAPLGLKVVPVMLQQDERADVEILLGGDSASRATWTTVGLDLPASTPTRGDATATVVGTIYAGPAAPPTTSARVPLSVPEGASYVIAWMNTTANVGIPDIDLGIDSPKGENIATSGTPTPREAVRIAGPNLRGSGEYALVVTTAGSPRAEVTIEWLVGAP